VKAERDRLQGERLIAAGLVSPSAVSAAYQRGCGGAQTDLCGILVGEGLLDPAVAIQLRQALSGSGAGLGSEHRLSATPPSPSGRLLASAGPAERPSSQQAALAQSSEPRRIEPGDRIGRYRVVEKLAEGGMGAVYVVERETDARRFALKVLLSGAHASDQDLERFRIEAEATARLAHDNIVGIQEINTEGQPWFVMELVEGEALSARLAREGPLEPDEAAALLGKLAGAMAYAHGRLILHRDIKPDNILLRKNGEPVLTDFGLAKRVDSTEGLTVTGQMMGTPRYMPPEQADGATELIDRRADIYSLGATLYEMLTGEPPFVRDSLLELIVAIQVVEPVPPGRLIEGLSQDLETICLKCLEKVREQRYESAGALAKDLQSYLEGEPIVARRPSLGERLRRSRRRHPRLWAGGLLATLLGCLIGAWSAIQPVLEARRYSRSKIRTELRLRTRTRALVAGAKSSLDALAAKLPAEDEAKLEGSVEAEQAALGTALGEFMDESALRSSLRGLAREAAAGAMAEAEVDSLAEVALNQFPRRALLARAAWLASRRLDLVGERAEATRQALRAYRLDPRGEYGRRAFLRMGRLFLRERKLRRALGVFRGLLARRSGDRVAAQALLGTGRALLALGRIDEAGSRLEQALAMNKLNPNELRELRWVQSVVDPLRGQATLNYTGRRRFFADFLGRGKPQMMNFFNKDGFSINPLRIPLDKKSLFRAPVRSGKFLDGVTYQAADGLQLYAFVSPYKGGPVEIETWGLKNGTFAVLHKRRTRFAGVLEELRVLAAGDVDGDSTGPDILLHLSRKTYLLRNLDHPDLDGLELEKESGSLCRAGLMTDLDGDGRDEMVLGVGPWNHCAAVIYSLPIGAKKPRELFRKTLGAATDCKLRLGPEGPEVLLSVDRSRGLDVKKVFGTELSPELPDAVWSLRWAKGEPLLSKLFSLPFSERSALEIRNVQPLRGLVPTRPRALLLRVLKNGRPTTLICPGDSSLGDLPIGLPRGRFRTVDWDGDGGLELIVDSGDRLTILGLAEKISEEGLGGAGGALDGRVGPLSVVLDLLSLGEAKAAHEELDRMAATGSLESGRMTLLRAEARAMDGQPLKAMKVCETLVRQQPAFASEALMRASLFAEQGGDTGRALALVEELSEQYYCNPEQRLRVNRRLRQLRALNGFTELFRFDRDSFSTISELGLRDPLGVKEVPDGLRVGFSGDYKALIGVPLILGGASFRLRTRFRVESMNWGGAFTVALRPKGRVGTVEVRAYTTGGGDEDSFLRRWGVSAQSVAGKYLQEDQTRTFVDLDRWTPDEWLDTELTYDEVEARFEVVFRREGQAAIQRSITLEHALPPGLYVLEVGALDRTVLGKRQGQVIVDFVSIETSPGNLGGGLLEHDGKWVSEQIGRMVALGQDEVAVSNYRKFMPQLKEPLQTRARLELALVLGRLGRSEEAAKELKALRWKPKFQDLVMDRLAFLSPEQRRLIGEAFVRGRKRAISLKFGLAALKKGAARSSLRHFLAAGGAQAEGAASLAGWLDVGDYAGVLKRVARLRSAGETSEEVCRLGGIAAYRLSRFKKALELWGECRTPLGYEAGVMRARAERFSRERSP